MEKQTKISYIFFGLIPFSILLHNLTYALTNIEEVVFFSLVIISTLGFVVSVIWNTVSYLKKGRPKDIWKLGWLGFFGFLGLIGIPGLYGLFGLYGFFGAKSWQKNINK